MRVTITRALTALPKIQAKAREYNLDSIYSDSMIEAIKGCVMECVLLESIKVLKEYKVKSDFEITIRYIGDQMNAYKEKDQLIATIVKPIPSDNDFNNGNYRICIYGGKRHGQIVYARCRTELNRKLDLIGINL